MHNLPSWFLFSLLCLRTENYFYSTPESCGGAVPLTYSSPYATFSTPHYFLNTPADLYIDCEWRVAVPSGEEVHLTLVDMETEDEELHIFNYPTSRSNRIAHMHGSLLTRTSVLSSNGGLTLYHDDQSSYMKNGRGLLFEARILGECCEWNRQMIHAIILGYVIDYI